jgi:hypothetical protein
MKEKELGESFSTHEMHKILCLENYLKYLFAAESITLKWVIKQIGNV